MVFRLTETLGLCPKPRDIYEPEKVRTEQG